MAEVHDYERSEGTGNRGYAYESRLTALLALRFSNSQKNFSLLTNAKYFKKWDDVVVVLQEGPIKKLYCFQLKHVTGTTNSSFRNDMFEPVTGKSKCILNLQQLFEGFQKIKSYLSAPENSLFRDIHMSNVKLVLFTNIKGTLCIGKKEIEGCCELFETKKKTNEDVTIDLDQFKKKKDEVQEWAEFFDHLAVFGHQSGEEELNLLIRDEIRTFTKLDNDALLSSTCQSYINYVDLRTDGKLDGFYEFTENHIRINFADILLSTLEILAPTGDLGELSVDNRFSTWTKIISDKSLVVLQDGNCEVVKFLYSAATNAQNTFDEAVLWKILKDEVVDVNQVTDQLKRNQFNVRCCLGKDIKSKVYSPKDTKMLLWKLGLIPLIVKIRKAEDMDIVNSILKIVQERKIQIIIIMETTTINDFKENLPKSLRCLGDVNYQHVGLAYEKQITVHGKETTLRSLLNVCPSLSRKLTTNNILQLITSECNVGTPFEEKSYHIPRQIPAIGLNTEVLKIKTDLLVICGKNATIRNLEFIPNVDVHRCLKYTIGSELTTDTLTNWRIILVSSADEESCYKVFQDVCSATTKSVHLIKLHLFGDTVLLQWLQTSKSAQRIRNYKISSEKLPKEDIESMKGGVNVLSADPGYGKTEIMRQLARHQTERLVVFITLAAYSDYFLKAQEETDKPLEHLRHFFNDGQEDNQLNSNIFDAFLEERKILVIVDGIDEVPRQHTDIILKFIQQLAGLNLKIWVTCRVCIQDEIENSVNTLALKLNCFNADEQNKFLIQSGFRNDQITTILDGKQELLEIPLYLYMVSKSLPGSHDMVKLCDSFIQEEVSNWCERNATIKNVKEYFSDQLIEFIFEYALYTAFPQKIIESITQKSSFDKHIKLFISSGYSSFGLIRKFIINNEEKYVFIHKAIGDYIAAKALISKDLINRSSVREHLHNEKLTPTRVLFYKILIEERDRSALKRAVIDKNYQIVLKCLEQNYVENVDEDFTTSLHLASQGGKRHYYPNNATSTFAEKDMYRSRETGTEKIVELLLKNHRLKQYINKKDKLFSWTPIQYADHSESIGVLEEFAKISTFNVANSKLLSEIPKKVLAYFCVKYHYNNLLHALFKDQALDLSLRCTENGNTLLHVACAYGNTDVLPILIDKLSIDVLNKRNETPLHVAAYGHKNVVSYLISKDSLLEAADDKGYTALHRAVKCCQEDIAKMLINKGADLETRTLNAYSLIHTAAYCNNVSILNMLINRGASVNQINRMGSLPLHTAVEWNSIECIAILIDKTEDINAKNKSGITPIHLAIRNGHLDIVKMLVSKGAKVILDYSMEIPNTIAGYLRLLVENEVPKEFTKRWDNTDLMNNLDLAIKMAALLSLRCCGLETDEMYLATDKEECGVFNDLILHKKTKDGKSVTYLMQLKYHSSNCDDITPQDFLAARGNYSLEKYREEIAHLEQKVSSGNQTSTVGQFLNRSNVVLILFTNRKLQSDKCDFLQKIDDDSPQSFLQTINTNGNIYKLQLQENNVNQLYDNFYLFEQQIDVNSIDKLIEDAVKTLIRPMKLSSTTSTLQQYLVMIREWTLGKLGGHCLLSKRQIISSLTDLLLRPYLEEDKINQDQDNLSNDSETVSSVLFGNQSLAVVDAKERTSSYFCREIIRNLNVWLGDLPPVTSWTQFFSKEDQATIYRYNQSIKHKVFRIVGNFGKINLLTLYKCMWIEGRIPLVLEITSQQDYDNILAVHRISEGSLKLILLNRTHKQFASVN